MRFITAGSRFLVVAILVPSLGLIGCGDDDPAGPVASFNPQQTAQSLGTIEGQLNADGDVVASLELVGPALDSAGVASLVLPRKLANPRTAVKQANSEAVRSFVLAGGSDGSVPIFPSNLLGKTFEWSDQLQKYVLNDVLTGAPSNGVRFLLYAIDPITRRPISPAADNQIGHLDLSDESSPSSTRLGLVAVTSGVTRIDYFIDASFTVSENNVSVTLLAQGFASDGSARIEFDLSQDIAISLSPEAATLDVSYRVESPADNVVVTLDLVGDFVGEDDIGTATLMSTITDGTNTVVLDVVTGEADALSGTLSFNGTAVITLSGTGENPVFTKVDGTDLTAADVEALIEIVDIVEELFDFAESVFDPFDGDF